MSKIKPLTCKQANTSSIYNVDREIFLKSYKSLFIINKVKTTFITTNL